MQNDKNFVQSPCGHGFLIGLVPYDGWSGVPDEERKKHEAVGHVRWGITTVVKRRDHDEPVECCSHMEGEFETREQAQETCDLQKRHAETQLNEALVLLEGLGREVGKLARVSLDDLIAYRWHLQDVRQSHGSVCDEPLCFDPAISYWWDEDGEQDRRSCAEHYKAAVAAGKLEYREEVPA